jgi:COPII coat assembly protein SEC16
MGEGLRVPPTSSSLVTSISNFPAAAMPPNVPPDVLSKWTETVAMMISSPMSVDTSSALTALGDQLASNQWIEAAHAWYVAILSIS